MPREILVDWTTASGSDHRSVFMFGDTIAVAGQRTALAAFLGDIDAYLDNNTTWVIENAGRELDDATGALTGAWSDPTSYTGTGAQSGEAVNDAAQGLIRWRTNHVVGGRFLNGRTFIPGMGVLSQTNGNVNGGLITAWNAAATTLCAAAQQLGVWHRPILGTGGVFWAADSGDTWSEFAVLRRRR